MPVMAREVVVALERVAGPVRLSDPAIDTFPAVSIVVVAVPPINALRAEKIVEEACAMFTRMLDVGERKPFASSSHVLPNDSPPVGHAVRQSEARQSVVTDMAVDDAKGSCDAEVDVAEKLGATTALYEVSVPRKRDAPRTSRMFPDVDVALVPTSTTSAGSDG